MGTHAHVQDAHIGLADAVEIGWTLFCSDQPLSKHYSIDAVGQIEKWKSGHIVRGLAYSMRATPRAFCDALGCLASHEAISNGQLAQNAPQGVPVATKHAVAGVAGRKAPEGAIARTKENLVYRPEPGLLLLDVDAKNTDVAALERIQRGVWPLLVELEPALAGVLHIERASTSAGIERDDGLPVVGIGHGQHIYVLVADMTDAERTTQYLANRLEGEGLKVLDRTVASPERMIYEAPATLGPGLRQPMRPAVLVDGSMLDTKTAWPQLEAVPARQVHSRASAPERQAAEIAPQQQRARTQKDRACWAAREQFLLAVLKDRGVEEGSRNDMFWLLANAVAWQANGHDDYMRALVHLRNEYFAGWALAEAMNSASAVTQLMEGGREPYKMKTETLLRKLEATSAEKLAHSHLLRCRTPRFNEGVLNLPRMKGLSREEYAREKKERQQAGAAHTTATRAVRPGHSQEVRDKAKAMALLGCSTSQIMAACGVSRATAKRLRRND